MEKSRSLIRQVIGHKMLFVVFLLFPTDIFVEVVATTNVTPNVNTMASFNLSTSPFPTSSKMTEDNFTTSVTSPPGTTMLDSLIRNTSGQSSLSISTLEQPPLSINITEQPPLSGNITEQPALSFNAPPPVAKQELQSATAMNTALPEDTSFPMRSTVTISTEEKHPRTEALSGNITKQPALSGNSTEQPALSGNITKQPALSGNITKQPALSGNSTEQPALSTSTPEQPALPGNSTEQPALSFNAPPPVAKQELQSATAMNTAVPEDTSSPMRSTVIVSTKEKHPRTEATEIQESKPPRVQKEVPSKTTVTPHFVNETVSSPIKALGNISQGSFFEQSSSTIAYPETTKSTEPKGDRMPPGQAVPELTQAPETGSHYMSDPFTTSMTPINDAPISDSSDKSSSEKRHSIIVLAVVFSILLLVGLLVFLYFRRRRHSGSTSFNSPEWAGQATLPDDTGLDKDVEQQVGSVGEGETRRGTLVTFFGKRQSRVPSLAMEDVNGKGSKEETEQLLCGEAEIGSPSEAIGDANGKVPEPLKGSSQESPKS